jgi:hypothetical protein
MLKESARDLYPEDLDFFETELATGDGYDDAYKKECMTKIKQIRAWMKGAIESPDDPLPNEEIQPKKQRKKKAPKGLVLGLGDVAPNEANPAAANMTSEQIFFSEVEAIRKDKTYKTRFKDYVQSSNIIDAKFVDNNYAFFEPWELDAIISVKQMGEEFLEKYFDALDHDKLARYQEFSEAFFMKHWTDLDYSIVLEHGKNEWRKKENRSKQLDVFLRLKGVKI